MLEDLTKLGKYLQALGLTTEIRKHKLAYLLNLPEILELAPTLAKLVPSHQLVVEGEMGKMSIIKSGMSLGQFEIYNLEGDLFEGHRRYKTMTDCGRTVYGLLTTGIFDEKIPRVWDAFTDFLCNDSGPDGSVQDVILDTEERHIFEDTEEN